MTPGGLALVTGFPGFIGRRLVAALLGANPEARVAALVEPGMAEAARGAAAAIDAERIELLQGDIAVRRLGLPAEAYERLAAEANVA